jgi:hypothetical protein
VRWEDRTELFIDRTGNEAIAKSIVYTNVDLEVGDYLALGTSTEASPVTLTSASEVRDFRKIPDLKNNFFERRALMSVGGDF